MFDTTNAVPKLPIYSASFLGTTGNVIVSGRRQFFYIYDANVGKLDHIPKIVGREEKSLEYCVSSPDGQTVAFGGNDGCIILYDARNKQWVADLKLNGSVRTIVFSPDGSQIVASGSDGDVYTWDMRHRKCIDRFPNVDCTPCWALALSSQHLAVGAQSGVVNLYSNSPSQDDEDLGMIQERKPIKSTATVFANWPTNKTPLGYVWSMDFSPESRFFAIGNDKGKCMLYRLKHYDTQS